MTEALLAEGCNVSYCSRNATGTEYADFPDAPAGTRAVGSVLDIMDPQAIKAWVDKSAAEFGRIDIVVANGRRLEPGLIVAVLEADSPQHTPSTTNRRWKTGKSASRGRS